MDDGEHGVIGLEGHFASPSLLLAPTVGDALRKAQPGAKVVSLSVKDRGAVLPGGKDATTVLWFEDGIPGFTSSTYYGEELPAFLQAFQAQHPIAAVLEPWTVPDGEALQARLGPDDSLGEGDLAGFGTAFPHDPQVTSKPYKVAPIAPALSERLLSLAQAAVDAEGLGKDGTPDLLIVSISGTDYAGHVFGPDSWEYFDHLRRADRALGRLLQELSERGPLAVVVSSDHGVARLSERRYAGRRLSPARLVQRVESALDEQLQEADWVEDFTSPYLYLTQAARTFEDVEALRNVVCQALSEDPDVAYAVSVQEEAGGCGLSRLPADLRRAVGRSLHPKRSGEFYVVPVQNVAFDESYVPGFGTQHGTPWSYDRLVPVLVWGEGVASGCHAAVVGTEQVAPTLSALLGIEPPSAASAPALPFWEAVEGSPMETGLCALLQKDAP